MQRSGHWLLIEKGLARLPRRSALLVASRAVLRGVPVIGWQRILHERDGFASEDTSWLTMLVLPVLAASRFAASFYPQGSPGLGPDDHALTQRLPAAVAWAEEFFAEGSVSLILAAKNIFHVAQARGIQRHGAWDEVFALFFPERGKHPDRADAISIDGLMIAMICATAAATDVQCRSQGQKWYGQARHPGWIEAERQFASLINDDIERLKSGVADALPGCPLWLHPDPVWSQDGWQLIKLRLGTHPLCLWYETRLKGNIASQAISGAPNERPADDRTPQDAAPAASPETERPA